MTIPPALVAAFPIAGGAAPSSPTQKGGEAANQGFGEQLGLYAELLLQSQLAGGLPPGPKATPLPGTPARGTADSRDPRKKNDAQKATNQIVWASQTPEKPPFILLDPALIHFGDEPFPKAGSDIGVSAPSGKSAPSHAIALGAVPNQPDLNLGIVLKRESPADPGEASLTPAPLPEPKASVVFARASAATPVMRPDDLAFAAKIRPVVTPNPVPGFKRPEPVVNQTDAQDPETSQPSPSFPTPAAKSVQPAPISIEPGPAVTVSPVEPKRPQPEMRLSAAPEMPISEPRLEPKRPEPQVHLSDAPAMPISEPLADADALPTPDPAPTPAIQAKDTRPRQLQTGDRPVPTAPAVKAATKTPPAPAWSNSSLNDQQPSTTAPTPAALSIKRTPFVVPDAAPNHSPQAVIIAPARQDQPATSTQEPQRPTLAASRLEPPDENQSVQTKPPQAVKTISLHVSQPDNPKVQIRLSEEAGELRVAVHSTDSDLSHGLRQGLSDLVGRLQETGFRAETWRPAEASPLSNPVSETHHSDDHSNDGGSSSQQGWSQQDRGQQQQHQSQRPRWVEELESSLTHAGPAGASYGISN